METYVGPGALFALVGGALRLRREVYRDVSHSPHATRLCIAIVLIAGALRAPFDGSGWALPLALVLGILFALGTLLIESSIVWAVCRGVLGDEPTFGQVARPLAAAHAPRLALPLVSLVGAPAGVVVLGLVWIWMMAAFVVAIRALTDRGWAVAVGVAAIVGLLPWLDVLVARGWAAWSQL